jgi:hypothetical protein
VAYQAAFSTFRRLLDEKLIIVGNAKHRIFRLRIAYLIGAGAGLFCALAPVPRVVKEGLLIHCLVR